MSKLKDFGWSFLDWVNHHKFTTVIGLAIISWALSLVVLYAILKAYFRLIYSL